MEHIIIDLKEEEAKAIFGGEKYIIYIWDSEGNCIAKHINT